MKVLAIIDLMPDAPLESIRAKLAEELRASWTLYASGVARELYATDDPGRVVFVMEAEGAAAAARHLAPLPLVAAGMFKLELLELRPFVNWSMLFARSQSPTNPP